MLPTLDEAIARYGTIENGIWLDEAKWCVNIEVPHDIVPWINSLTGKQVTHIYCNVDMADALVQSLCNVRERGLISELHTFDGCYQVRSIRGRADMVSTHAYALAIDILAATNQLGADGDISAALVQCFTDQGFIWGGTFKRLDKMHFQYAQW